MKNLAVVALLFTINSTITYAAAFDCTELENKEEMMACLRDMRLVEDKYKVKDACTALNKPKTQDQYKLCVAIETKKDPFYGYKKYGTQEGSQYEKCFIGKESSVMDSKREAKVIEKDYSTPRRSPALSSEK